MTERLTVKKIQITNKLGLHARAAAKFVKISTTLSSQVWVKFGKYCVCGTSILGLMSLAAKQGSSIEIKCKGKRSFSDLQKLVDLIKNNFGEEKRVKQTNVKEKIFKGIGVSSGVFIGECFLKEPVGLAFSHYKISKDDIRKEVKRFDGAVKKSILELNKLIKSVQSKNLSGNNEMKFILEAHVLMLRSSSLVNDARKNIEKKLINAEWSIVDEHKKHEDQYKKIKDNYFRERFDDVKDVCRRIISNLKVDKLGKKTKHDLNNKIVISEELSAADLMVIQKNKISGLISGQGGPEGHFAIIARSLSIPTVVGVKGISDVLKNGEKIIIDGDNGFVIRNPNNTSVRKYSNIIEDQNNQNLKLNSFKNISPITIDKKRIFVEANVDTSQEVKDAMGKGIDGIGLFRSEYLYMNRKNLPSENEQFHLIKDSLSELKNKKITIRTLDIGNDKQIESFEKLIPPSPNPALGLRAIRLTLAFPKIFEKQISAILRASFFGSLRIMLPMVSNVSEFLEAKEIILNVRKKLKKNKIKISNKVPEIGVLIETPAAALISDSLAKHCDFFAIGTNDLTMYTLAIDRGDETVAKIYDPGHLSVLKLIKMTSEAGKNANIPVSICGEMAGDVFFTALLIGMGIDILSMSTSRILKVKQFINLISVKECFELSKRVTEQIDSGDIKKHLEKFKKRIENRI